tara:strand:- start:492 stop:2093 length:1602 start_codon:yes stop_codon:yes gene_type:complete
MYKELHIECIDCKSSDALVVNANGSTKCFSCGVYRRPNQALDQNMMHEAPMPLTMPKKTIRSRSSLVESGFSDRRITISTAIKYATGKDVNNNVYFPYYDKEGTHIAYKVRGVDKTFKTEGDIKNSLLFGQQLFAKGGKFITICEGEFDALAAYQLMGSVYPAVSIRSGAQSALSDCKANFEWLDSFESIVICFDNDKPGLEATAKVAELFGNKAKIFKGVEDLKDACDWLKAKKEKEWNTRWWSAEAFKPEGIVTITDIKERMLTPPVPGVAWCFPELTRLTYGRRKGELYAFGAGVGVGKTDVFTQQIAYDIDTLGKKVGVIYLEQNVVETGQRVIGKLDERLYHVPDADWTRAEYVESINKLEAKDQLYMMEHFGTMDWKTIKSIIKFFNKAYDIEHIYLDHLTALSANELDERRALDGIMADMASLAQELGVIIHFISHLTTPDGKPHEEGGRVMEKHFTGSRAIARWSHYMFGLERNKQHADLIKRQTTTVRVLKDRFTGRATGMKFGLLYDQVTGMLSETLLTGDDL